MWASASGPAADGSFSGPNRCIALVDEVEAGARTLVSEHPIRHKVIRSARCSIFIYRYIYVTKGWTTSKYKVIS